MWATWSEEKSSHCRTLKTVSWEGTGKAWHSSADPSPKQTLVYKYWIVLSNPQFIFFYTGLTLRCHTLWCPIGGAAGRWASHSFCPQLRGKGLPTNQNLYSTGEQWYVPTRIWSSVCICWVIKHQICSTRILTASFEQLLRPSWRTTTPVWWILGKKKCDSVRYLSGTRPTLAALMRRWEWILFGCIIHGNKLILFVALSPSMTTFFLCSCSSGLWSTWVILRRRPAFRGSFLTGRRKSASSHMTGAATVATEVLFLLLFAIVHFYSAMFLKRKTRVMDFGVAVFMQ